MYPFIGNRDVDKVLRKDIEDLLLQRVPGGTLWESQHVTADRVRGRIDAILQRAVNHDLAPKNVALEIKDDLPKIIHKHVITPQCHLRKSMIFPLTYGSLHAQTC